MNVLDNLSNNNSDSSLEDFETEIKEMQNQIAEGVLCTLAITEEEWKKIQKEDRVKLIKQYWKKENRSPERQQSLVEELKDDTKITKKVRQEIDIIYILEKMWPKADTEEKQLELLKLTDWNEDLQKELLNSIPFYTGVTESLFLTHAQKNLYINYSAKLRSWLSTEAIKKLIEKDKGWIRSSLLSQDNLTQELFDEVISDEKNDHIIRYLEKVIWWLEWGNQEYLWYAKNLLRFWDKHNLLTPEQKSNIQKISSL